MSVSRRTDSDSNDPTVRLVRSADALTGAVDDFVRAVVNFTLETAKNHDPVSDQSKSRTGRELPSCPAESVLGYDRAEEWLRQTSAGLLPATAMRLWRAALKLGTFRRTDLQRRSGEGEGPAKRFLKFAEEKGKLRTNRASRHNRQEAIVYEVVRE